MDRQHYNEMSDNFNYLNKKFIFSNKKIYLFGHCNATEELAKLFLENKYAVAAILDNNKSKHGMDYSGIPVTAPEQILRSDTDNAIVCIAHRAYASMYRQLRQLGYTGRIEKMVDYNSFSEYSLSEETIARMTERLNRGMELVEKQKEKYPECFRLYCPFPALGDVYNTMAYLPHYLKKRNIDISKTIVYTVGRACGELVEMFGIDNIETLLQKDMDESVQAVFYVNDKSAYIAHNDKPYFINLQKVLKIKMIPHEMLYKYGVFGLDKSCQPYKPVNPEKYEQAERIKQGQSVILAPYAKSAANIPEKIWKQIIEYYSSKKYRIFTNVTGGETALPGTMRLDVPLSQIQSAAETAGTFIGLRSGLCDVIRESNCRKIALYSDCCYSDTKWKIDEIFHLNGWENVVINDDTDIEKILEKGIDS